MKISKKIMTSNLIIGFVVIFLLSLMILFVVNNFIRDNAFFNMEKEVSRMAEALKYRDVESVGTIDDNNNRLPVRRGITTAHVFIILDSEGELIRHTEYTYDEEVDEEFYLLLNESKPDQFNNFQLGKYPVITYKTVVEYSDDSGSGEIQIIGLVYNSLLYKLLFEMMVPIIIALFIVVILSFVLSSIYGKRITEPVEELIDMTDKISKKEVVVSTISSGDEFEVVSNAIEKMSKALNIKDIESKEFYEHVSHDLKTPLTIISGYAEGISNGIFDNNDEPLDKIVKHCDNLKHQIEDVIYLSQLESSKQFFELKAVAIEDVISEVLDDFEVIFLKKDIEVNYQPVKRTIVNLDYEKIIRGVSNIILNATKYTKSELFVEIQENNNQVKVIISDNGQGFSEKVLKEPFKGYYEKKGPGNGIGLMIVYKIMEAHGGDVVIRNSNQGANQGAIVELIFNS